MFFCILNPKNSCQSSGTSTVSKDNGAGYIPVARCRRCQYRDRKDVAKVLVLRGHVDGTFFQNGELV